MYSELREFMTTVPLRQRFWRDGELWTSGLLATACGYWFKHDPTVIDSIRAHFGDLLNVAGIVFGFALAALIFYIEAAGEWAEKKQVAAVAARLVDWHVWTVLSLLFLIGYILALWGLGRYLPRTHQAVPWLYGFLAFLILYCGFQILNHALTVRWAFMRRDSLKSKE